MDMKGTRVMTIDNIMLVLSEQKEYVAKQYKVRALAKLTCHARRY